MKGTNRIILHIDMNCFYASVEQKNQPHLKGKPVAVAGNPAERRGIIITCSYEARHFGVKTTMNVAEARRLCRDLIVLQPNFDQYREASRQFFTLLKGYTDLVEPVSIDECYMDITDICNGRHPLDVVAEIQRRIYEELDLPCSIGVAPNKFLAKTASDMKKPLGITVLRKRDIANILWPLPVQSMHGVGKKTGEKLRQMKINTIEDLAKADNYTLRMRLGVNGDRLQRRANGEDDRAVDPNSIYDTKSVGNSTTLQRDETNMQQLKETFHMLSEKVAQRLQTKRLAGTTVIIYIRDNHWHNVTRSKTVTNPIHIAADIFELAWALFRTHWDKEPVRLLGVTVSNVVDQRAMTKQLSMFNYHEHIKDEPMIDLVQTLEKQFGKGAIQLGVDGPRQGKFQANTSFSKDFLDEYK